MKDKQSKKNRNPFHQKTPSKKLDEVISYPIRLNKYIAKCGITSRRKAAELVKQGQIKVNDIVVREPYIEVSEHDQIAYEGNILQPETNLFYLLLNKPKDVITSTADEKGRKTVLDLIPSQGRGRLYPVGRLDRHTTGLLLITNDGDLTTKLAHPSHQVRKEYVALLDEPLADEHFEQILQGLQLEDGLAKVIGLEYANSKQLNHIRIAIMMGRNRIVRRIFEHLGYKVKTLDRTYYAGLTKKGLPRGKFRHLSPREVIMLKHFV
ncbi:MAG: rRNA pseudouridine synthase [Saprospiraceae bacterium]|nr:rRNA pseudouridine synthase [Saprospiraceae bacterium]